jgi:hypothetical protein
MKNLCSIIFGKPEGITPLERIRLKLDNDIN